MADSMVALLVDGRVDSTVEMLVVSKVGMKVERMDMKTVEPTADMMAGWRVVHLVV